MKQTADQNVDKLSVIRLTKTCDAVSRIPIVTSACERSHCVIASCTFVTIVVWMAFVNIQKYNLCFKINNIPSILSMHLLLTRRIMFPTAVFQQTDTKFLIGASTLSVIKSKPPLLWYIQERIYNSGFNQRGMPHRRLQLLFKVCDLECFTTFKSRRRHRTYKLISYFLRFHFILKPLVTIMASYRCK